ncbi:hypothetical protein AAMO2058_000099200 [Amorphochlora amoebiformis]
MCKANLFTLSFTWKFPFGAKGTSTGFLQKSTCAAVFSKVRQPSAPTVQAEAYQDTHRIIRHLI